MKTEKLYWPGDEFTLAHSAAKVIVAHGEELYEPDVARRLLARYAINGMHRVPPDGAPASAEDTRIAAIAVHDAAVRLGGQSRIGKRERLNPRLSDAPDGKIDSLQALLKEKRELAAQEAKLRANNRKANEEAKQKRLDDIHKARVSKIFTTEKAEAPAVESSTPPKPEDIAIPEVAPKTARSKRH